MVDVFISYSRENQEIVRRLAEAVRRLGYAVWWDDELPPHLSYGDVISEKVGQAKAAIVVWSQGSIGSEWVRAEADLARNQKKLIQTCIDDSMPPMPFNQIQFAAIGDWDGGPDHPGWRKVQVSLTALCGPPSHDARAAPAPAPVPPPVLPPAPPAPPAEPPVRSAPPPAEPTSRTQTVFVAAPPRRSNVLLISVIAASIAVLLLIGGLALFRNWAPADSASASASGISSRAAAGQDPQQILPDSSVRRLAAADIAELDAGQRRLARNEIYARNGRIFEDAGLRAYFSRYSWYRPRSRQVTLTAVEQANVNLLQQAASQAVPPAAASAPPQAAAPLPPRQAAAVQPQQPAAGPMRPRRYCMGPGRGTPECMRMRRPRQAY